MVGMLGQWASEPVDTVDMVEMVGVVGIVGTVGLVQCLMSLLFVPRGGRAKELDPDGNLHSQMTYCTVRLSSNIWHPTPCAPHAFA